MSDFRYGFCGMDFEKILTSKALGSDYHELKMSDIYSINDEKFEEYKKLSKDNNILFETANCMVPGSIKLTGENVNYAEIDAYLEKAYSRASQLGVKVAVFGSAGARNYAEDTTYDMAFEQLVVFLKDHVAPVCEKYSIVCALEDLSYGESNILNTIEESYKMVQRVNSNWVRILVDFYHFGYNKDSFDWVRKAEKYIYHIHVASVLHDRDFPAPNDGENYQEIVDLLREIGYDKREARITFEAYTPDNKDFKTCAKESLDIFKNLK